MRCLQLRHVHLRYQDTPHCNSTFEFDDSTIVENGFTCSSSIGNVPTLTSTVKCYSESQGNRLVVGFGHWCGQNWLHVVCEKLDTISWSTYDLMLGRAPEHAQTIKEARSGAASCRVCIMETPLPRSTWILQTSCVMCKSSRTCGVNLLEVFRNPRFGIVNGQASMLMYVDLLLCTHTTVSLVTVYTGNRRS